MTKTKHLVTVFWDSKGLILLDTMPSFRTMTAEYYCLLDALKEEMKKQRRRMISDGYHRIDIVHDNAHPHVANITKTKLYALCTRAEVRHFNDILHTHLISLRVTSISSWQ